MRFKMSASEFLLKFQMWTMQDNVSDLKKRYLFFSALIVYALAIGTRLIIDYFDPISKFRQVENPAYLIVYVSLLVGLAFSLISMGFVYICRSVGIKNLYSSMLFLASLDIFRSALFEGPLTGPAGFFFCTRRLSLDVYWLLHGYHCGLIAFSSWRPQVSNSDISWAILPEECSTFLAGTHRGQTATFDTEEGNERNRKALTKTEQVRLETD